VEKNMNEKKRKGENLKGTITNIKRAMESDKVKCIQKLRIKSKRVKVVKYILL
jgi:hypothetical protein